MVWGEGVLLGKGQLLGVVCLKWECSEVFLIRAMYVKRVGAITRGRGECLLGLAFPSLLSNPFKPGVDLPGPTSIAKDGYT